MMKRLYINLKTDRHFIFFRKIALLLVFLVIADLSLGHLLKYLYYRQKSGFLYRTTYSIEETKADLLVFGSSRANHHYKPEVFEKQLGVSFYNVGRDGSFIFYHYAVLKAVLNRYSPKAIILDFLPGEFRKDKESYDKISFLLPYYKTHPEIRETVEMRSRLEKVKLISSIYPYNSLAVSIIMGDLDLKENRYADDKGYLPLNGIWKDSLKDYNNEGKYEIDSIKIKTFNAFIKKCVEAGVKLYIVCSPSFLKGVNNDYSISLAKEIAAKDNVEFLDITNDELFFNHPEYYNDPFHLNDSGATVFSEIIAEKIKYSSRAVHR
jgi:hypothetical protein